MADSIISSYWIELKLRVVGARVTWPFVTIPLIKQDKPLTTQSALEIYEIKCLQIRVQQSGNTNGVMEDRMRDVKLSSGLSVQLDQRRHTILRTNATVPDAF